MYIKSVQATSFNNMSIWKWTKRLNSARQTLVLIKFIQTFFFFFNIWKKILAVNEDKDCTD